MKSLILLGSSIFLAVFVAACQPAALPSTFALTGEFAYIRFDGNLWVQDAHSGKARILVPADQGDYPNSPALSPDGRQVVFAANVLGNDRIMKEGIQVIHVDGTNQHVLATPAEANTTYGFPFWSPDSHDIYFTRSYSVPRSTQHDEIDRMSANGGPAVKVIDGLESRVSPDGQRIVFQRINYTRYTPSLWVANADGSAARQLMDDSVFAVIYGMRFSPDSQSIVLAASGEPNKILPGTQGYKNEANQPSRHPADDPSPCAFSFLLTCVVQTAEAHGLPWDLWLVNLDGTRFQRLTHLGSDSPVPVWSPDGKAIVFFDAAGIHLLDLETKAVYDVSSPGGFGGFDWR